MSSLVNYQNEMLPEFHRALQAYVDSIFPDRTSELSEIFYYHLGLSDELKKQGKRTRPMLTLLSVEGAGENWRLALPAAVGIELIHNFSLIHDDIEDNGEMRRGKETVWKKWGLAKGLNAGDVMFATAFKSLEGLKGKISSEIAFYAANLLAETTFNLTVGQQDDIGFESRESVCIDEYEKMIEGKTAALIRACCQMGALIAGRDERVQNDYCQFGHALGMAFQIYDDWLGVWGDESQTGKTTSGDLVEGKKSFPVLLGLRDSERFRKRWMEGPIRVEDTADLAEWLCIDGVEQEVKRTFLLWTEKAMHKLDSMDCTTEVKGALEEFANKLIIRNK